MLLSLWTLMVALVLSVIAGYYSVIGLATIFSAAPLPIIIMSATMEVAKVTTAVWLHRFWPRCKRIMKFYLVVAVIVLCSITSMGVFGLLAKAHSDQSLESGNIAAQVELIDEKIRVERENIETNRQALQQINNTINETISRSTTESAVGRAVQLKRSQSKEKNELQKQITDAQTRISQLNTERAPLAVQMRKVEAEVGPIKYIAAMVYGDNPDVTTLERAVRWVIIMLVTVFDPLAITMVLAANESLKWSREDREPVPVEDTPPEPPVQKTIHDEVDEADVVVADQVTMKATDEIVLEEAMVSIEDHVDFIIHDHEVEDTHIVFDDLRVSAKDASKVWKRQNPHSTMKEQLHLIATGQIACPPWEDEDFIRRNFS